MVWRDEDRRELTYKKLRVSIEILEKEVSQALEPLPKRFLDIEENRNR